MRDARAQLFDAAERVLLREGPNALTTRAVTTEAGCAKGVLHRHFADFDAFLAELVLDRISRLESQAAVLRESAGTGTVIGNLSEALTDLFGSVAREILGLLIFRDDLRARLREARPGRLPLLREATVMIAAYLAAEQELGRIAADADAGTLAATLIGAAHLQFVGRDEIPPDAEAVRRMVAAVIVGASPERPASRQGDAGAWLELHRRDTTAEAR